MASAINIPKLTERIKALAKTYVPPPPTTEVPNNFPPPQKRAGMRYELSNLIRSIALSTVVLDVNYWKSAGIRMEDPTTVSTCMKKLEKTSKLLGQGVYGKVFNVPVASVPTGTCFKHIPSGVKHIGVKVELMKNDYEPNQTPTRLQEVTKIAKRMGDLNIGPKLYDAFVTTDADGVLVIIKVFEVIDGKQWGDTTWETPKAKAAAIAKLESMIKKMNKLGVIHHDIHPGNVMVSTSGDIYIIDFDMAANVENEETRALGYFNESRNIWKPKGAASDEGVNYIFDKLVEEGSIVLETNAKATTNHTTKAKSKNKRKTKKAGKP